MRGICDQSLRYRIAVQDESVQHHCHIDIGYAPRAEQARGSVLEHPIHRREQESGGFARGRGQGRLARPVKA